MLIPVKITTGVTGKQTAVYDRSLQFTGRQFAAYAEHARDMRIPLAVIGVNLLEQITGAFTSEGATGLSGHWKQLSEPYGAWKEKHAPGVPTLIGIRPAGAKGQRPQSYTQSGRMRMQLLDPLSMHVTYSRLLYTPQSDIAGYHQTGTSKMPARPPVDPTPRFLHQIDRVFVSWISKLADASGL